MNPRQAPPRTDLPFLRHRRIAATAGPLSLAAPVARRVAPVRRVTAQQPLILTPPMPAAVLTRVQSGVGRLTVTARWNSPLAAGPVAAGLVVAYRKTTGEARLLSPLDGPYLESDNVRLDHRAGAPVLTVDLLRVRAIDRLLLACLAPASPLTGALILTTYGGSRVDLPVTLPAGFGAAALMTAYQVDGELVLRAEQDPVGGTVRDACLAYGYDRFTWLNPNTPVR